MIPFFEGRVKKIVHSFSEVITKKDTVIDIGAGNCKISEYLHSSIGCKVIPIDIKNYSKTNLSPITYNGKRIPFKDKTFDYSLLIFVLHHTKQPLHILKEASRVSRKGIIVIENDIRNSLKMIITKMIDSIPYYVYGVPKCRHTNSKEEWLQVFKSLSSDLQIIEEFNLAFGFFKNFACLIKIEEEFQMEIKKQPP